MKYIKSYSSEIDFNASFTGEIPSVSFIEDSGACIYHPIKKSEIGDVVLYDTVEGEFINVSPGAYKNSWYRDYTKKPIGVVAISNKYTPDGSTRVVALANMSMKTPETGITTASAIEGDNYFYWGGYGVDIPGLTNYTQTVKVNPLTGEKTGTSDWVRIPSDTAWNSTGYIDPISGYRYCYNNYSGDPNVTSGEDRFGPFPVLPSGEKNPLFYTEGMATNDFNGKENTKIISNFATNTTWKTASTINHTYEAGYYPPVFCCQRYKTVGTNAGDWYLPAEGEAMFLSAFYGKINSGFAAITDRLGSTAAIRIGRDGNYGIWYWSSSEDSSTNARCVNCNSGGVDYHAKSYTHTYNRVRAFLSL